MVDKLAFNQLKSLRVLYINYNQIKELEASVFVNLNSIMFIELGLGYNQISNLDYIQNLSWIQTVNLKNNKIRIVNEKNFMSLKNLTELDLSENPIEHIDREAFSQLTSLLHLKLNKINLDSLASLNLEPLTNRLRTLQLSENWNLNLKNSSINKFSRLRELYLSRVNLKNFYDLSLKCFPDLANLDLSYNNLSLNSTSSMSNLFLKLNLSYMDQDHVQILQMKSLFRGIQSLDLSHNRIKAIGDNEFCSFNSSDNLCKNLDYLDLSYNLIENFDSKAFDKMKNLKILKIQKNVLGSMAILDFTALNMLKYLDASECNLKQIPSFQERNNLIMFLFAKNKLRLLKESEFSRLKDLQYLGLSSNEIEEVELSPDLQNGVFYGLTKLEDLDLSINRLNQSHLSILNINNLSNLVSLNLSYNRMTHLTAYIFEKLEKLLYLDVSENQLKRIESRAFYKLTNLLNLYLIVQPGSREIFLDSYFINKLDSLKVIYISSAKLITSNLDIILKTVIPRATGKVVNNHQYFFSIQFLFTMAKSKDKSLCRLTLLLLKYNIQLNLRRDADFDQFIFNCYDTRLFLLE